MSKSRGVDDVICLAIPVEIDAGNPEVQAAFMPKLEELAAETIAAQYAGYKRPTALVIENIDWMVTDKPEDIETFQPAHDCEQCRLGNIRALDFLSTHPTRFVAMGNIHYVEVWNE